MTPTQALLIAKAREWEPAFGIGKFVLVFGKTLRPTSAAETGCPQKEPWTIVFNSEWIESERAQGLGDWYFPALLAHEMCHAWLDATKKQCPSSEEDANACGRRVTTTGRPN